MGMARRCRASQHSRLVLTSTARLARRARVLLALFIVGLLLSGLTAFPIERELRLLTAMLGAGPADPAPHGLVAFVASARDAVTDTNARYPFLAYGTDWLAFAHIVLAVLFLGPLRDPVRNVWVVTFGLIACAGIIPLALIAGPIRGIPFEWRLIDCSFGIGGALLLWPARRTILEMEARALGRPPRPRGFFESRR